MAILEHTDFDLIKREAKTHDTTILLGYSILAIVFLIVIYFASLSSGTAPGDFATMTVFP
jgi:hypothetical protein